MSKTYANPFTLDGRLPFGPGVSQKKIEAAKTLVERALSGDRIAEGMIREALVSTSDFALNFAQLVNATVLPDLDEVERVSSQIAGVRRVTDFRDNYLYGLARSWRPGVVGDGQEDEPLDHLPTVPEGTPYPEAIFAGELIQGSSARKAGIRTGITWEAIVNDTLGLIQAIPGVFRNLALNTVERDVFRTLIDGATGAQAFAGGTSIDGTVVGANAPLSRAALDVAITQLQNAVRDQYQDRVAGGYRLVVGVGQGRQANFLINNLTLDSIRDGNLVLNVSGANPLAGIEVVESVYVEGTDWYLIPTPGTTQRPVLDRLVLIGHEEAELRVHNLTGNYLGGSSVPPFEGSFDADTADWRVRLVSGAVLWSPYAVVWSTGQGAGNGGGEGEGEGE